MACFGVSAVTPVKATKEMAIMANAPIGRALPIIATMVATNSANKCQALSVTPSGVGITNQIIKPMAMANRVGIGLKGSFSESSDIKSLFS